MEMQLRAISNCYFDNFIHMYIGVGYSITVANTDRDTRGHVQTAGKSWLRGYEKMIFRGTYIVRQWNNLCEHESDFRNLRRFKKY